jgi:hypothetical protein
MEECTLPEAMKMDLQTRSSKKYESTQKFGGYIECLVEIYIFTVNNQLRL